MIDEFLHTRPQTQTLCLIPTTRSQAKCDDTVDTLKAYLKYASRRANKSLPEAAPLLERRVEVQAEILDLSSLRSVRALAQRLQDDGNIRNIDAVIFNAGIGGWTGLDWFTAIWTILTDTKQALTWPTYKRSAVGGLAKPQLPMPVDQEKSPAEPSLGEVFCANTFGHYVLGHHLAPMLPNSGAGRVIWVSSLEAYAHTLNVSSDFQGIHNPLAYESSKRVADILALTSRIPSATPWVRRYYQAPQGKTLEERSTTQVALHPKMYTCHPGICSTGIMPLNWLFTPIMILTFYFARLTGSMWHTCNAYKGACAPVWLALASQETLDALEAREGVSKWGSAVTGGGDERVERTEVEGWGYGGIIGDARSGKGFKKGRWRGAKETTKQDRTAFEDLGVDCWSEMERMRIDWEQRLDAAGI